MRHPSIRGFTLLELIVVIAIIGVLSVIILPSFTSALARSRDAKRISELAGLKKAIQAYAMDNGGVYPTGVGCINQAPGTACWPGYATSGGGGLPPLTSFDTALAPYINISRLKDPLPNRPIGDKYVYFYGTGVIHCSGPAEYRTGAYIAYDLELTPVNKNYSDSSCAAAGGEFACCLPTGCALVPYNYFCLLQVN